MLLLGRHEQLDALVQSVLEDASPRIAILGPGGVGKSSLALAVLHDATVAMVFQSRRFFVPCDAVTTTAGLTAVLASQLSIFGNSLHRRVLTSLSQTRTIVVLDNFETPFEASQMDAESFLSSLSALDSLSLLVTMRGAQRPSGASWTRPFFPALRPLDRQDSLQLFLSISGLSPDDSDMQDIETLLDVVDDLPLAVCLLARMAQYDTPRILLRRWDHESMSMVNAGQNTRLSSLDVSITLSLSSSRLAPEPQAIELLKLLSVFQDGMLMHSDVHAGLLATRFDSPLKCASLLKQVALAFASPGLQESERLHVLSPIRSYVLRNLPLSTALLGPFKDHYIMLAADCHQIGSSQTKDVMCRLVHEAANIQSLVEYMIDYQPTVEWPFHLLVDFDIFLKFSGLSCLPLLHKAMALVEKPDLRFALLMRIVCHEPAFKVQQHYAEEGLKLARQHRFLDGEAEALLRLATAKGGGTSESIDIYWEALLVAMRAEPSLGNAIRQGQIHQAMAGSLQLADRYAEAWHHLHLAIRIFEACERPVELLKCYGSVAHVALRVCDFSSVDHAIRSAAAIAVELDDVRGLAQVLSAKAQAASMRSDIDESITAHMEAIKVYSRIGFASDIAFTKLSIAELYLGKFEPEEARPLLAEATVG